MDYGVSRAAEQWRRRRRSINNSASEQRGGGGDSLPPFVPPSLALKKVDAASNRAGEVPLIAASCIGPGGRRVLLQSSTSLTMGG